MSDDLFTAAIDRLERRLAAVTAERDTLAAELAERSARVIVSGERVALFPSTRRRDYIAKAVDQIAQVQRPEARERIIIQRCEATLARLLRNGVPEHAARADVADLDATLRAQTGVAPNEGGRSA